MVGRVEISVAVAVLDEDEAFGAAGAAGAEERLAVVVPTLPKTYPALLDVAAAGPILLCACSIFSAFAASVRASVRFCVSCSSVAICADMLFRWVGVVVVRVVSWRSRVWRWDRIGLLVVVEGDVVLVVGAKGKVLVDEVPMRDSREARRASRAVAWLRMRVVCASRAAVVGDWIEVGFGGGSEVGREGACGVEACVCAVLVVVWMGSPSCAASLIEGMA